MKHHLTPLVLTLGLAGAAAPPAHATTFIELPTVELARSAHQIAVGRVLATESRWVGSRIVTRVALRADDAAVPVVWFEHTGGSVDGITMEVIGMPRFAPGERVVVLLRRQRERLRLIGLGEGKLAIEVIDGRELVRLRAGRAAAIATAVPLADAVRTLTAAMALDGSAP
jgi:hypothetical protein